ncbi:ferric-dicitrate binding protein FerR (iron transport regulator) [Chitinophaga dinghuensis]|uniref:Ferric-dicitrate binding protein FerR (Iron transport regulator) n=1 Tax=Chitinophaga dinghuensis TaxID=1539050 RepID=A0A327VQT6_9BACT|nr:FecR family protein [Chitinophaga dinghuensis]RAJ77561.1 ferric-dicitrate binding protein FerR (iron transport regulator) [Chitinophaga dinghuensis]
MEQHINDTIIAYLNDPGNQELANSLEPWLNASADNRQLFEEMRQVWESAGQLPQEFSSQKGWELLQEQLTVVPKSTMRVRSVNQVWWRVAAVVFPLLVLTGIWYSHNTSSAAWHTFVASRNGIDSVLLEDGSQIILRPGTTVLWRFNSSKREVKMQQGEAFVKVAKDATRAFSVQLPNGTVTVLGTSFNIKSTLRYSDVAVREGRVSISGNKGTSTILTAGDLAVIDSAGMVSKSAGNYAYRSNWTNPQLRFRNMKLDQVVRIMESAYQIKIAIQDSRLSAISLNADFSEVTREVALEELAVLLNTDLKHLSDSTYQLGTSETK